MPNTLSTATVSETPAVMKTGRLMLTAASRPLTAGPIIMPMPEKFRNSARFSAFFDIGNVFSTGNRFDFRGRSGQPVEYDFEYDKLKHSTGIAVQWLAPLGVFRFSYAVPLNAYKGDANIYPDEVERFQFSVGQAF